MADIFISYASEDRDRVIPIVRALEEQGWSTFWDWKSIPVGKTWREFIDEGLEAARCILVLWSTNSTQKKRRWVLEECDFGLEREIFIPAMIDDVRPPRGFGQIQAARLMGWEGKSSHEGFQQLIKALIGLLGPAKMQSIVHDPLNAAPPQQKITNSIGMEFVVIPAGSFTMGSRMSSKELMDRFGGKEEWYEWEKPHHAVKIERPFYLQTTPVTQGQWQRVMGDNPSNLKGGGDECPVEQVSWGDTQRFIEKLNGLEKTKVYRLPTEAEWEYACRAGTDTHFYTGDTERELDQAGWYIKNSEGRTHPVGGKKPNDWGLYDMHGNVWEWVEDDWHGSYKGAPDDGRAWIDNPRGSDRVMRGGSWFIDARSCRSAMRSFSRPGFLYRRVGFRLSRSVTIGP